MNGVENRQVKWATSYCERQFTEMKIIVAKEKEAMNTDVTMFFFSYPFLPARESSLQCMPPKCQLLAPESR